MKSTRPGKGKSTPRPTRPTPTYNTEETSLSSRGSLNFTWNYCKAGGVVGRQVKAGTGAGSSSSSGHPSVPWGQSGWYQGELEDSLMKTMIAQKMKKRIKKRRPHTHIIGSSSECAPLTHGLFGFGGFGMRSGSPPHCGQITTLVMA